MYCSRSYCHLTVVIGMVYAGKITNVTKTIADVESDLRLGGYDVEKRSKKIGDLREENERVLLFLEMKEG